MYIWTHEGDFEVTKDMVENGRFIKGEIPTVVSGDFNCRYNKLTSLEGGPKEVGGFFDCHNNNLTSLEGGPNIVGGDFWCNGNKLINLIGGPVKVGGDFNCRYNNLTSLEGGPKEVGGSFDCSGNKLINLIGGPIKVGGRFDCSSNKLTSLIGGPNIENILFFYCENNINDLTIEKEFIMSGSFKTGFYIDLLYYCITNKIDLEKVESWPENFLTDNIKCSVKGISKFKL